MVYSADVPGLVGLGEPDDVGVGLALEGFGGEVVVASHEVLLSELHKELLQTIWVRTNRLMVLGRTSKEMQSFV